MHLEKTEDISVLTIPGTHLDAGNAGEARKLLVASLEKNNRAVFDLSGLNFVDSSGLSVLISCLRKVSESGGELKLSGLQKPVRTLFELVKMHKLFETYETVEDAVASFTVRYAGKQ